MAQKICISLLFGIMASLAYADTQLAELSFEGQKRTLDFSKEIQQKEDAITIIVNGIKSNKTKKKNEATHSGTKGYQVRLIAKSK